MAGYQSNREVFKSLLQFISVYSGYDEDGSVLQLSDSACVSIVNKWRRMSYQSPVDDEELQRCLFIVKNIFQSGKSLSSVRAILLSYLAV